eukprot:CAMPEP_0194358944 /NCGR_PEP_ID=MMETSP0174-20130528/6188_1 /TAXON_ID=216777 /ORGANISM="Proboscia alata, Strain PI-D3" /LENGTH=789 /DNA_ID=CAMNT_0039129579 /DNA_START=287 /DNA_END=2656 /DNA_ORIENTATION=+
MSNGNNTSSYECLFTHHKTQKKKKWLDGKVIIHHCGNRIRLYMANPLLGSSDKPLDEIDGIGNSTTVQPGCQLESEKYLITIEGLWQPRKTQNSALRGGPSAGMKKVLNNKFRLPGCAGQYVPKRTITSMGTSKRRRPLQPGELERIHYGETNNNQNNIYPNDGGNGGGSNTHNGMQPFRHNPHYRQQHQQLNYTSSEQQRHHLQDQQEKNSQYISSSSRSNNQHGNINGHLKKSFCNQQLGQCNDSNHQPSHELNSNNHNNNTSATNCNKNEFVTASSDQQLKSNSYYGEEDDSSSSETDLQDRTRFNTTTDNSISDTNRNGSRNNNGALYEQPLQQQQNIDTSVSPRILTNQQQNQNHHYGNGNSCSGSDVIENKKQQSHNHEDQYFNNNHHQQQISRNGNISINNGNQYQNQGQQLPPVYDAATNHGSFPKNDQSYINNTQQQQQQHDPHPPDNDNDDLDTTHRPTTNIGATQIQKNHNRRNQQHSQESSKQDPQQQQSLQRGNYHVGNNTNAMSDVNITAEPAAPLSKTDLLAMFQNPTSTPSITQVVTKPHQEIQPQQRNTLPSPATAPSPSSLISSLMHAEQTAVAALNNHTNSIINEDDDACWSYNNHDEEDSNECVDDDDYNINDDYPDPPTNKKLKEVNVKDDAKASNSVTTITIDNVAAAATDVTRNIRINSINPSDNTNTNNPCHKDLIFQHECQIQASTGLLHHPPSPPPQFENKENAVPDNFNSVTTAVGTNSASDIEIPKKRASIRISTGSNQRFELTLPSASDSSSSEDNEEDD